jgi:hypothetical protein
VEVEPCQWACKEGRGKGGKSLGCIFEEGCRGAAMAADEIGAITSGFQANMVTFPVGASLFTWTQAITRLPTT